MKKELNEKLYKKYPKLFARKNLGRHQTCMTYGCECGDGWYDLINNVCSAINGNQYLKDRFEFEQIKEKFGALRIYFDISGANPEVLHSFVQGVLSLAETVSMKTCEWCGETKDVKQAAGHWVRYLCRECRLKQETGYLPWNSLQATPILDTKFNNLLEK